MLGLQALDCSQTATLEGSPGSYADPKESTIIDARYVECFTFVDMCCCSALHSAARLMQVIVADSTFECSQSGFGWPASAASPTPWRLGAPHRIAILESITRSALAILALGRSRK
jgi:hypothetical protein